KKSTIAQLKSVWPQIWALVKPRRLLMATSFVLLIINRVTGLALPFSSRILIDRVIPGKDLHLLWLLVAGITLATVIQAVTSYVLMQTLSKEGQRAIAELRRNVQAHVGRLAVSYYDSTKTGSLVSRIMSDVEGVRNLIGTGLMEFAGGILTAAIVLVLMIRISYVMTAVALGSLVLFSLVLHLSFTSI